jgi:hypothetical protein
MMMKVLIFGKSRSQLDSYQKKERLLDVLPKALELVCDLVLESKKSYFSPVFYLFEGA